MECPSRFGKVVGGRTAETLYGKRKKSETWPGRKDPDLLEWSDDLRFHGWV